jgi:hypothetical protein
MDATESDSVESLLERRLRVLGPGLSLFYDPLLVCVHRGRRETPGRSARKGTQQHLITAR